MVHNYQKKENVCCNYAKDLDMASAYEAVMSGQMGVRLT